MPPRTHKLASEHMNRYAVYVALTRHRDGVDYQRRLTSLPRSAEVKIPSSACQDSEWLCHFPVVVPVVWQPGQMWVE